MVRKFITGASGSSTFGNTVTHIILLKSFLWKTVTMVNFIYFEMFKFTAGEKVIEGDKDWYLIVFMGQIISKWFSEHNTSPKIFSIAYIQIKWLIGC